jgi:DnaJ-domain-containing proteins 1
MKAWGKLLGGALGFALGQGFVGTTIGLLIGVFLGHQLDRTTSSGKSDGESNGFNRSSQAQTKASFFAATFSVMGHISKSDGRVSPEEIQLAEQVMQQMRLGKEQRISAIEHFNRGKQEDFDLDGILNEFRKECEHKTALMQMFVEIQLQAAYADGVKNIREEQILQHICGVLGYPEVLLAQLESMLFASKRSRQSHDANSAYVKSNTALEDAYKIIGVSETATDGEIKKAYRRLMSQNHPDKLIAKGLPEEMIEIATNKTQEIQKAYDLISENRK